jgi:hypothetical protein
MGWAEGKAVCGRTQAQMSKGHVTWNTRSFPTDSAWLDFFKKELCPVNTETKRKKRSQKLIFFVYLFSLF